MKHREHFDFVSNGRPFRAVFEPAQPGVRFKDKDTVAFYDRTYDFTPDGQFTGASYHAETILGRTRGVGLILQGGEPLWTLTGEAMDSVRAALAAWEAEERDYVVGLPVVVTVDKYGVVRISVDTSELTEGIHEQYPSEFDTQGLTQEQVDHDVQTIQTRLRTRGAIATY